MAQRKLRKGHDRPTTTATTANDFFVFDNDEEWQAVKIGNNSLRAWESGEVLYNLMDEDTIPTYPYLFPWPLMSNNKHNTVLMNQQGIIKLPKNCLMVSGGESNLGIRYLLDDIASGKQLTEAEQEIFKEITSQSRNFFAYPFIHTQYVDVNLNYGGTLFPDYNRLPSYRKSVDKTGLRVEDQRFTRETLKEEFLVRDLIPKGEKFIGLDNRDQVGFRWVFDTDAFKKHFSIFYPKVGTNASVSIMNDYTFTYTGEVFVFLAEYKKKFYFAKLPTIDDRADFDRFNGKVSIFDAAKALLSFYSGGEDNLSTFRFDENLSNQIEEGKIIKVSKEKIDKYVIKPVRGNAERAPLAGFTWTPDQISTDIKHHTNVVCWKVVDTNDEANAIKKPVFHLVARKNQNILKKEIFQIHIDKLGLIPIKGGSIEIDVDKGKVRIRYDVIDEDGYYISDRRIRDNWMDVTELKELKARGERLGNDGRIFSPPNSDNVDQLGLKDGIPSNLKFHYIPNKEWCTYDENTKIITCTRMKMMHDIFNGFRADTARANYTVPGPTKDIRAFIKPTSYLSLLSPWDNLGIDIDATIDISYFPPKFNNKLNTFMPAFLLGGLFLNHDSFIEQQGLKFPLMTKDLSVDDKNSTEGYFEIYEEMMSKDIHGEGYRQFKTENDFLSAFVSRLEFFLDPHHILLREGRQTFVYGEYPYAFKDLRPLTLTALSTKPLAELYTSLVNGAKAFSEIGRHHPYGQFTLPGKKSTNRTDKFSYHYPLSYPNHNNLWSGNTANNFFKESNVDLQTTVPLYPGFHYVKGFRGLVTSMEALPIRVINEETATIRFVNLPSLITDEINRTDTIRREFTGAELRYFKQTFLVEGAGYLNYPSQGFTPEERWRFATGLTVGSEHYNLPVEYAGMFAYRFEKIDGSSSLEGFDIIDVVERENNHFKPTYLVPLIVSTRLAGYDNKISFESRQDYLYGDVKYLAYSRRHTIPSGSAIRAPLKTDTLNFFNRLQEPTEMVAFPEPDKTFDYKRHAISAFYWWVSEEQVTKQDPFVDAEGTENNREMNTYAVPFIEWNGTTENSFIRYPNNNVRRSLLFTSNEVVNVGLSVSSSPLNQRPELVTVNPMNGYSASTNGIKVGLLDERGRIIKPNARLSDVLAKVETAFYPPYTMSISQANLNADQPYMVFPNEMRYFRPERIVAREEWFKPLTDTTKFYRVTGRVDVAEAKRINEFFTCTPKEFFERYLVPEERGNHVHIWRASRRSFPIKYFFQPFKSGRYQTELLDLTGVAKLNKQPLNGYSVHTLDSPVDDTIRLTDNFGLLTGSGLTMRPSFRIRKIIDSDNTHRILLKNYDKYGLPFNFNKTDVKDIAILDYWDTYKLAVK